MGARPAQRGDDDVVYTGYLTGMKGGTSTSKPKARANIYALGAIASPRVGGSTSRVGLDSRSGSPRPRRSWPPSTRTTRTSSSISRASRRPRRAPVQRCGRSSQGANFYNNFNCNDCPGFPLLYTPNIPTPRDGFAVEGTQGPIRFAGFDSLGNGRTDTSQAIGYRTSDHHENLLYQRTSVDLPGIHDVAEYGQFQIGNAHNFSVYTTQGRERGSLVANNAEGNFDEYGLNFYTPKEAIFAAYHDLGAQYSPIDSFTQINDIHGPSVYTYKEWDFDAKNFITTMTLSQDYQHYHNRAGVVDDTTPIPVSCSRRTISSWSCSRPERNICCCGHAGRLCEPERRLRLVQQQLVDPTTFSYNVGRFGRATALDLARTTLKMGPRATPRSRRQHHPEHG